LSWCKKTFDMENDKPDILNESEVVYAARIGVTRKQVNDIIGITGFTLNEMGQYVHVAPRTLQRKKLNEKLPSDISEKVLLIQNLYLRGSIVLGSLPAFKQWMSLPNIALGGSMPKEFLDTFSGIEYIMQELGRIEHGFVA
jgi:putative toxin-antitoxin system antitoxin component (TIGR02293 family)